MIFKKMPCRKIKENTRKIPIKNEDFKAGRLAVCSSRVFNTDYYGPLFCWINLTFHAMRETL